ncbi:hypothetical protein AC578_5775 [Pseudocercospora eumusae]|uniref:Uncharacterized protein n=1 Tax=Pseudocercospora eumusae TaxID=321146 RepID=A0A139H559_9PEZI|nr:hypothetical protein AC578_5775 [Pseudocercospora eumusae]
MAVVCWLFINTDIGQIQTFVFKDEWRTMEDERKRLANIADDKCPAEINVSYESIVKVEHQSPIRMAPWVDLDAEASPRSKTSLLLQILSWATKHTPDGGKT